MSCKSLAAVLGATVLLAGLTFTSVVGADEVISIGTLAPQKSTWGKVFSAWDKAVRKKSKGQLKLKWYYDAQQGDELDMVAKMRSGKLDGAVMSGAGLGEIHRPILALQMPGLLRDWKTIDKVRDKMAKELIRGAVDEGFLIAGWSDVGLARPMSKGKEIRTLQDLKTMKVYRRKDDPTGPVLSSVIGYPSVQSSVPALLPALSGGRIDFISVPCLAAVQMQWWSHLDHMVDEVVGAEVGGLVFSKERVDKLPADLRKILLKTGRRAGKMLTKRVRKDDDKAYRMLKQRMTVVTLTEAQRKDWAKQLKVVRKRLGQGVFSKDLVEKLEDLSGL